MPSFGFAILRLCFVSAIVPVFSAATAQTPPPAAPAPPTGVRKMDDAISKQRESVRKQAPTPTDSLFSGSFFTVDFTWQAPKLPMAAAADCPAMAEKDVEPLITAAATAQGLKPELIRAVIRQESAFRPCAVSAKGAMGLMQIMPATADDLQLADPYDPASNIQSGARYLKQLMDRYQGNLKLALAAYNAGPGRVDDAGKTPDIPETQDYVNNILKSLSGQPR